MKRNNIIYPNTPFFRKYVGKLIVPAGADIATPLLLYIGGDQFVVISPSDPTPAIVTIDGSELGEDDYNYETYGVMTKEMYYEILEQFPDLPVSIIGGILGNLGIEEEISAGEHSISVTTADGSELSTTFTVE
jgi:hypothetical protein